jgi:hypothetical protein
MARNAAIMRRDAGRRAGASRTNAMTRCRGIRFEVEKG